MRVQPLSPSIPSGLLLRLYAAGDIPGFWTALQALVQATVPCDALVVYLNFLDFATSWRAARILATPNAQRPQDWFEERRQVDMTPQFVLAQARKVRLYRLSDVIPDPKELMRTEFFRGFLAPHGWRYLAVGLFWRGSVVASEIALRRTEEQGDFSAEELERLEALYPHVESVLNRILAREEESARRASLERLHQQLPFAVLFLDWQLEPVCVNQLAYEACATWNFGREKARVYHARTVFRPPEAVLDVCKRLKTGWLKSGGGPGAQRREYLQHPSESGFTAAIALQGEDLARSAPPGFVISFETRQVAPGVAAHAAGHLARLTHAERTLAIRVCGNQTNKEIAAALGKTEKTVKAQLTSVYRKLGIGGRMELAGLLR